MSTHNLCFRAKIRKNVYPCTPQFHYIKMGCKGVEITRTCLHDTKYISHLQLFLVESANFGVKETPLIFMLSKNFCQVTSSDLTL